MPNNTTYFVSDNFSILCSLEDGKRAYYDIYDYTYVATYSIILVFAPLAVTGNSLILAAIWKKTFQKTPFHILLSALAFADLCTGLTSPFLVAAFILLHLGMCAAFVNAMLIIGLATTEYLMAFTILIITFMSVERWLHMSRRSLVTSRRGFFTAAMLSLVPIPLTVFTTLNYIKGKFVLEPNMAMAVYMLCCYLTTSVAYFKVFRIIRQHQRQVQENQPHQNFGPPAINLAKYRKSVVSISYILALFSFCFLPMIVSLLVIAYKDFSAEARTAYSVSLLLIFLSSSLNPGLYVWRMKDVRGGVKKLFCTNG